MTDTMDLHSHSLVAITLETGSSDRVANMRAFSAAALDLLLEALT